MARSISDEELQLRKRARRGLIGAIVLVTAAAVVLPMVLDSEPRQAIQDVNITIPSPDSGEFTSKVVPVVPSPESKPPPGIPATAVQPEATAPAADSKTAQKASAPPAPVKEAGKPEAKTEPAKTATKAARESARTTDQGKGQFVVQVVALSDAAKAKQIQQQISAAGIKSYTQVVKTAKGDVTRVRAGPFATRAAAEKARDQLKAMGLNGNVATK